MIMAREAQDMKENSQRGKKLGPVGGETVESGMKVDESSSKLGESRGREEIKSISADPASVQLKNKEKEIRIMSKEILEQTNGTMPCNQEHQQGYKLEYVEPPKQGENQMVEIELEDIKSEIKFWGNAIVCYVIGAHPPFQVVQGFIQRLWGKHGIDKVSMLKNGVIVVRFESKIGKQEVLQGGIYHFDNKPFIVKEWTPDLEFTKEELQTVPI
ncbi:hypothetical protein H5410_010971 [Solanum commersonii]|uniref:DUF4283 domain-containing protein n=1 Tax=Solanum commersonii TaxID=4109 RepID=A0A9J6AN13_SOLCO|nr:hypothetical protein H5410_010971 [Solanum commersonii]